MSGRDHPAVNGRTRAGRHIAKVFRNLTARLGPEASDLHSETIERILDLHLIVFHLREKAAIEQRSMNESEAYRLVNLSNAISKSMDLIGLRNGAGSPSATGLLNGAPTSRQLDRAIAKAERAAAPPPLSAAAMLRKHLASTPGTGD